MTVPLPGEGGGSGDCLLLPGEGGDGWGVGNKCQQNKTISFNI